MTEEQYWSSIRNIPLFFDCPSVEPGVSIYRDQGGNPVRVVHPESLSVDERVGMIELYEMWYSPRSSLN